MQGAFYYMLGNLKPSLRSGINTIQLLILAKYTTICEFGIDQMLKPAIEDIKKLVLDDNSCTSKKHNYTCSCTIM